jgi:four helix bundle protein
MGDFKKLTVWQRSVDLTEHVCAGTRVFPREELYGLSSQLRRAATSSPANIAEGTGRFTPRDEARCFRIALGSATEVECLLLIAR